jgi:tetratricopeptide (TPR) repeat protein
MIVDGRRDHSIRVPRPDLHDATGAPDACTGCHRDRAPAWAAQAIEAWHGRRDRPRHWGEAIASAWRGDATADGALLEVAGDALRPAIARGTALSLLRDPMAPAARAALERALDDADGLVRLGALAAFERGAIEERVAMLPRLLADPTLAIRTEAARLLAEVPSDRLGAADRAAHERVLAEYRATQEIDADRPEAHLNLGNLALSLGDLAQAEREYREALRIDPTFAPAHLNLADLERLAGRDPEAVRTLRDAVARLPEEAVLHHALGLALVRAGDSAGALSELERAYALAPQEGHYAYVLGVALHSAGRAGEAVGVLERALAEHSGNADLLTLLATIERERGNREAALRHARRLASLHPGDRTVSALVEELSAGAPATSHRSPFVP